MAVTFARTRHEYGSYSAFWRVVELSGYPIVYVDQIDPYDPHATYVITPLNGEWQEGWKGASARIVLWDLEWRDKKPDIPGVSDVWASDVWYASQTKARYVTLGSHPGLCPDDPDKYRKDYDVIWISYMVHRRNLINAELEKFGVRVARLNPSPEEQVNDMLKARMCIHVHQHENIHTISPTRWMQCAAYRLPILSELVESPGPFTYDVFWCDYRYIAEFAHYMLKSYRQELDNSGQALYSRLCHRQTFRAEVDKALA